MQKIDEEKVIPNSNIENILKKSTGIKQLKFKIDQIWDRPPVIFQNITWLQDLEGNYQNNYVQLINLMI